MGGDHASGEVLRGAARHGACAKWPVTDRTIAEVASPTTLWPKEVGSWVARYRKEHATDQDIQKASESA